MKLKALASVAMGLALIASQASAATATTHAVKSGVQRATTTVKGSNKLQTVDGVLGFFYLGVFIAVGAVFISQASDNDGKTSP
jgi:hypothetical protein